VAANLIEEPERFIREMMEHNLPLAGRCAAQADVEITGALRNHLRAELRARCVHPEADLRARILAGKALGELGDPQRLMVLAGAKTTEYLLPEFAEIPAGNYTIGGDTEGFRPFGILRPAAGSPRTLRNRNPSGDQCRVRRVPQSGRL